MDCLRSTSGPILDANQQMALLSGFEYFVQHASWQVGAVETVPLKRSAKAAIHGSRRRFTAPTCMEAGPVLPKETIKSEPWISCTSQKFYPDNVER